MLPDLSVYGSIIRITRQERRWERFRWNPFTNHRVWVDFEAQLGARLDGFRDPTSPLEALRQVIAHRGAGEADDARRELGHSRGPWSYASMTSSWAFTSKASTMKKTFIAKTTTPAKTRIHSQRLSVRSASLTCPAP